MPVSGRSIRNLKQYKDLTDEEFEEIINERKSTVDYSEDFEDRIAEKYADFERDYDVSDLKINDFATLRALIQAIITLEDYEQELFFLRSEGIGYDNLTKLEKLNKFMSDLRGDISKMQTDLNITRKIRKGDSEETVVSKITELQEKAKKFYSSRMLYIFCPKCKLLLSTTWFLYPDSDNKITFTCKRPLEDGEICGNTFTISSKDLLKNRGKNIIGVPEF